MRSIPHLVDKLLKRVLHRSPRSSLYHQRETPLTFGEILAASTFLEFGGILQEMWWREQQETLHDPTPEERIMTEREAGSRQGAGTPLPSRKIAQAARS